MVGVFAAATARLTPEFVESFDPKKLAAKFVRVEKEFGVKFTKSNSTFNIVGHWEAVRKAHKSLQKLTCNGNFDENCSKRNEEPFSKQEEPRENDTKENFDTDSYNVDEVPHTLEKEPSPEKEIPLFRGKGNPKRGRFTTKESPYSAVPEPFFFLQYQDKTFTDAGSLDIDTVLEDFEKSHLSKKVTKEQLKKILEKNKDQMGKPLEKGIPKGAILPDLKVTEQSCDTFVVEDMLNPITPSIPPSSVVSSGIFGMPIIVTDQTAGNSFNMGTGQVNQSSSSLTSIDMSNPVYSQMITTYSVNAKMSTHSPCNNQVNSQGSVAEEHMNISGFYNHSNVQNGRLEGGVFSDNQYNNTDQMQLSESDSDSFSSMFENYDPQAMLNHIPSSEMTLNFSEGSGTRSHQINTKSMNSDTGFQGQSVSEEITKNEERDSNTTEDIRAGFPSSRLTTGQSRYNSNGVKMDMNSFEEKDTSTLEDYTEVHTNHCDLAGKKSSLSVLPSSGNTGNSNTCTDTASTTSASHTVYNNTLHSSVTSGILTGISSTSDLSTTVQTNPSDFVKSMITGGTLMEGLPFPIATEAQTSSYSSGVKSLVPALGSGSSQCSKVVSENAECSVRLPDAIITQVKDITIATDCEEGQNIPDETTAENATRPLGIVHNSKEKKEFAELVSNHHEKSVSEELINSQNDSISSHKKTSRKSKVKQKLDETGKVVSPLKIKKKRLSSNKVKETTQQKVEKVKGKRGRKPKSSSKGNKQDKDGAPSKETATEDMTRDRVAEGTLKQADTEKSEQPVLDSQKGVNSKSKEKMKKKVTQSKDKSTPELKEKQVFKCTECDYQGFRKKRLSEHMGRVHGLLANGNMPENPMFSCDECEKTFVFEKDLSRHKKIVHHGQIFVCLVCNKTYKSKYVYDRHTATHAEGYVQPKFKCQICDREFTTKFSLSSHIKSEHLGMKKTYSCPTCGKTFSQIRSYRQHANVHAGIRPYTCEICGKSFTYDKSLKEHRYMHDTVRRFQCTICQKAFRQQTCLLIHMRTHKEKKDHICSVCGRGFTQKQSLLRHERIHTGDKPYICKICFKTFGDYAVIRKHIMMAHKKGKDAWKEHALTEESKRSSHYIDGGPGYVPRDSYAKINQKSEEIVPPSLSFDQVTVSLSSQDPVKIGNPQSVNFDETPESEIQRRQIGSDISAPMHNNFIALQDLYQVPSLPEPLDFNVIEPLKVKHENLVPHANHSIAQNMATETFCNTGSQQNQIYITGLATNPGKIAESCGDAYASQFLNSPGLASNFVSGKASVSASNVKDAQLTSSASDASVEVTDSIVAGSLVTMATTNTTWIYPGYSAAYFSPASFSHYNTSPDT